MFRRRSLRVIATIAILTLFILISSAQAEEPYDLTLCSSGTVSMLLATQELTVIITQGDGVTMSNHENNKFHGMSYSCNGITKIEKGVRSQLIYCKYMDGDGDLVVGEGNLAGKESTWKFLYGSGKWQGITGGGPMGVPSVMAKPIREGTYQVCMRAKGTFNLP